MYCIKSHIYFQVSPSTSEIFDKSLKIGRFYPGLPYFSEGHPGFRTFFNFFFENGIKRYQVTNLSGVHDDLKLCPKNNPL